MKDISLWYFWQFLFSWHPHDTHNAKFIAMTLIIGMWIVLLVKMQHGPGVRSPACCPYEVRVHLWGASATTSISSFDLHFAFYWLARRFLLWTPRWESDRTLLTNRCTYGKLIPVESGIVRPIKLGSNKAKKITLWCQWPSCVLMRLALQHEHYAALKINVRAYRRKTNAFNKQYNPKR